MSEKFINVSYFRIIAVLCVSVFCHGQSYEFTTMVVGLPDHCDDPRIPEHAIRTPPKGAGTFYVGSKVHYSCEPNYKLRGSAVLQCVEGGAWLAGAFPSCVAQGCPVPEIFEGYAWGDFIDDEENGFKPGGKAHVACFEHYYLENKSANQNTCQKNGKWAYQWPRCIAGCAKPTDVDHSTHMMSEDPFSDNYMYKQGATVTYKCNPGFRLTGDSQLGCGESGLWKGTVPRCEKDCHGKPASISNGYYVIRGEVDGHDQYISGTEVTYYCDAQHTLFGNNKLYCSNGLWNGIPPTCKMQSVETCPMPKSSPHGYIITSKQSFSVGSKVKYTCEAGYQLEGDCRRTRTNECERECLPTGIWSGSPPICIPNGQEVGFCSDPGKPENGERCCQSSFQSGDKLSFYCDAGFARTGSSERTCLSDGSWSGSQPICYPVSSLATNPPDVDGIFLTNTTLTIVIATTGTVLGVLIIVILLSIRQCHYRNRRFSRSLPMRHSHRRANYSVSPDDIDRVALIAYANGLEVVLPSYEEATASVPRSRPPSFTETNESADNNNGNTTPAASVPNPIPLPPRTHSSRFRRLPRIPRGLRLPPPPPLSMLDERRTNPEQPSNSAGRSAEAGVQTQADSAPTDGAPSSGETERTCEPVEDDRTSDTAGLLLLENEISQVTSAAPNTDVTAQTCDAVEDDYDDVELLTDLGGPLEEEQTQENVQQDDSQEANREETQGTETSTMGTNDNHEHHEENPSSEDT